MPSKIKIFSWANGMKLRHHLPKTRKVSGSWYIFTIFWIYIKYDSKLHIQNYYKYIFRPQRFWAWARNSVCVGTKTHRKKYVIFYFCVFYTLFYLRMKILGICIKCVAINICRVIFWQNIRNLCFYFNIDIFDISMISDF